MKILFKNNCWRLLILAAVIITGARVEASSPFQTAGQELNDQLIAAAKKGDVEAVKALLAKGADINAKSPYGATPLFFACDRGHLEIVKILLDKGADSKTQDTFYKSTPVSWAVSKDQAEIVKLLVEKSPESKESTTAQAVMQGQTKTAVALVETGGYKPESLSMWLGIAEKNKNTELVEALKKAGAKPPAPKPEYKIAPDQLQRYIGGYKNERLELSFAVKEGKLIGTANGYEMAMSPIAEHTFELPNQQGTVIFQLEGEKVVGMILKGSGGDMNLKKQETK